MKNNTQAALHDLPSLVNLVIINLDTCAMNYFLSFRKMAFGTKETQLLYEYYRLINSIGLLLKVC